MKKEFRRGITVDSVEYGHLRGRLDTESVLEDLGIDVAYKLRENQWMAHCPDLQGYHSNGDSNPSFGFNDEKLAFNCFKCGGGNIVELVQMMKPEFARRFKNDIEKDQEAIRYLEQFADFNKSDGLEARIQAILHPQKEEVLPMPDYPLENLFQYHKIHPYLYERGLVKDVIVDMQVGFDMDHLSIVIPHIFMNKLVGIQRRHIVQDETGKFLCPKCELLNKPVPKYKNTPNFPKVNTLYGYDYMKNRMRVEGGNSVIVVESPMTMLKLASLGFHRTVATFGQFSKEQGMLLLAVPLLYYWPDNDAAGYENTQRFIETMSRYTNVKIVPALPSLKGDAAELNTAEEVSKYLQHSYSSSLFGLYSKDKKLPVLDGILTFSDG